MRCLFLCADLMFASRVLGAAKALGVSLKIIPVAADVTRSLTTETELVILDLTMPGLGASDVVAAVREVAPSARIVAFGPHVDEDALAAARAAGCEVLSRSQFQQSYTMLLESVKAS